MNERQIEIYDFILSLAYRTIGITNVQIASLVEKYCYNTILSISEIKAQIQTAFLGISKEIAFRPNNGNLFSIYGITTEEELLKFIHENHEYGFLDYDTSSMKRFPLGRLQETQQQNKITTYDDSRIVSYLEKTFESVPTYLKQTCETLSDLVEVTTKYLYRKHWHLQSPEDTLRYMIGTNQDYLELAAQFFEELGLKIERYQFSYLGDETLTHLFLAYEKDNHWYYFEPLFEPFYGIHSFETKEELEQNVFAQFLTYYTTHFDNLFISFESLSDKDKETYEKALELQDKAIYDHRLAKETEEEQLNLDLEKSCYDKWQESVRLISNLPKCFEFYQLRRMKKPKKNCSFDEYESYRYYQVKITDISFALNLYQKKHQLMRLALSSLLVPGTYSLKEQLYFFQPMEIPAKFAILETKKREEEVLSLFHEDLFALAYHTVGATNTMFFLGNDGNIREIQGVDLYDIRSNIHTYPILNAKMPFALMIDENKKLQFRGMADYTKLYHDKAIYDFLTEYHFKCPTNVSIFDFSEEFLQDNKLPRLQESIQDYVKRVGVSSKITSSLLQDFSASYPKGVWFGQMQYSLQNPLKISHLNTYLEKENIEQLQTIFDFACSFTDDATQDISNYLIHFAQNLGNQISLLFNQNYYYKGSLSFDDISLSGEFCGDSFIPYEEDESSKFHISFEDRGEDGAYYFQFFYLVSSLKILLDASYLVTKVKIETPVLLVFLGSFLQGLTYEKQDAFFEFYRSLKKEGSLDSFVKSVFKEEFSRLKDNKYFYRDILVILNDFADNTELIVEKTNAIIKEQNFMEQVQQMPIEERFVTYLKRRFKEGNLDVSKASFEDICDHSKVGLLLRKEPLMVQAVSTLVGYQIKDFDKFLEVGHDLLALATCDEFNKRKELEEKLKPYITSSLFEKPLALNVNLTEKDTYKEPIFSPPKKVVASTSGMATPFYLIFVLLGTSCIVLGIILSFIL